ncbi:uncharacterized protein LOC8034590 [Ixodes scapularis]|uniref:uncharacterized protein LOC8034590 n=1 Tax=Ixodes scapularis TaxID=6945 RepID=UPI001C380CD0|nr:uncharacterized protein LOC8034590 [Ixodes scapularis]
MAGSAICFLLVATLCTWATASSSECDQTPLVTFNLNQIVNCGFNGESWSVWNVPNTAPYCGADVIDKSADGKFLCYDIESGTCNRIPYIYGVRSGGKGPNFLERDLGNASKTTSLILDTDNCHYLVQLECFPDGSVSRYVTYKSSWTSAEKSAFKTKAASNSALSFVQDYTFDCANGNV